MSEKTIALSGAETEVHFSGANAWLRNDGAAVVYAAKTAGVAAGADGVVSIPAGQSAPVYGANGTVFLLGAGSVQIIGSDYYTNPFDAGSARGGTDVVSTAAGIVTLDGLQGGVPFSGITLSGDDIVGQEITIRAGGENLLKFGGHAETETISGVTFTRGANGVITANGTATAVAQYLSDMVDMTDGETYTLTGCPAGGSSAGYAITNQVTANITDLGAGKMFTYDSATFGQPRFKIRIAAGYTCDNVIFRPVLCSGAAVITKITPDSAPYTVPDDIRQRDGVNTVSVSAGNVAVTGVRRNAAIGNIWGKIDALTAAVIVSGGETE
ncbi:MAG: hypothetical protein ACI4XA_03355 [Oscillospiraceae bacterium]